MPRKMTVVESFKLLRYGMSHPKVALQLGAALNQTVEETVVDPAVMRQVEDILEVPRGELFDYGAWGHCEGLTCRCGNNDHRGFAIIMSDNGSTKLECCECGNRQKVTRELWQKIIDGGEVHE